MKSFQNIVCVLLLVLKVHGVKVGFHTSTVGPVQYSEQEHLRGLHPNIPSGENIGPIIDILKERESSSASPQPSEEPLESIGSPSPESVENLFNELTEAHEETILVSPTTSPSVQFDLLFKPSQSPEPLSSINITASSAGSSTILSGLNTPSNNACITVTVLVVTGTLLSVLAVTLYGRSINPYRPFITGASLSEDSLDFNGETVPDIPNDNVISRDASTHSRRYQALSLERDVGSAQHYEAARLLEEIPDRHRMPDQT